MPTLLRVEGVDSLLVSKGGAAAKIWPHPVRVEYAYGLNPGELRGTRELTLERAGLFLERWNEYFGR